MTMIQVVLHQFCAISLMTQLLLCCAFTELYNCHPFCTCTLLSSTRRHILYLLEQNVIWVKCLKLVLLGIATSLRWSTLSIFQCWKFICIYLHAVNKMQLIHMKMKTWLVAVLFRLRQRKTLTHQWIVWLLSRATQKHAGGQVLAFYAFNAYSGCSQKMGQWDSGPWA